MTTKAKVLSQMGSAVDSAQMISVRNQVIKNRRERNETARVATFQSIISKASFLIMATVVILTMVNPAPIKMIWGKIAPYILL